MARKKNPGSSTRRWHRGIGVGASLFVVFLVVSGLTLNHAHQLGLDQKHIAPTWLLRWYGLAPPENIRSFAIGERWLSSVGSQLYLDGYPVTSAPHAIGAVAFNDWVVAAAAEELLMISEAGELIERTAWEAAARGPIEAIGFDIAGSVVVESSGTYWRADKELIDWEAAGNTLESVEWSRPEDAPADLRQRIIGHYNGEGLSLERLLLDIHSGRIFGRVGMLVYDLLALVLGFSAVSGLVLWWRTRGNGQNGRYR